MVALGKSGGVRRWRLLVLGGTLALAGAAAVGMVKAAEGPFAGVDAGASTGANANYRAHVDWGPTLNPFGGYMWNDYLGLQAQAHVTFQEPDTSPRRDFPHVNETTTVLGLTAGPRVSIPFFSDNLRFYGTVQGGGFLGVSGRLNHGGAPGFSTGGGFDYSLTDNLTFGFFGRWNRAYMSPRPNQLAGLVPDQQGPADARWVTSGVSLKYSFAEKQVAPPPPPPPPPPAPAAAEPPVPEKKKIVLRGVNFDTDKWNIRKDAAVILDAAVTSLKEEGAIGVLVVGHTDSRASDAHNQKLSERRAQSVMQYLIDHGIDAARLKSKGMGESQPVATNDTAEGRAQNRRVELLVE